MARTVQEIKAQMTSEYLAKPGIREKYGLNETITFEEAFSKISIESVFFYVVAFAIWTLEKIFETHKQEVQDIIATQKPHRLAWYVRKAKAYPRGFDLIQDEDIFNNDGKTEEQIEKSKIVRFAAASESLGGVDIKVAKLNDSNSLEKLSSGELASFTNYMNKIRDAGVILSAKSDDAYKIKLKIEVYYNPLVLSAEGKRIDGTDDKPVINAVKKYLENIEFDGTIILAHIVDKMQEIEGVVIPTIQQAQYQPPNSGWADWSDVKYRPGSGYAVIDETGPSAGFNITYKAYENI